LYADAGEREALDFNVIEVPAAHNDEGQILHSEYLMLGFKVANINDGRAEDARLHARKPRRVPLQTSLPQKESL
jgi:hypothetical protein